MENKLKEIIKIATKKNSHKITRQSSCLKGDCGKSRLF